MDKVLCRGPSNFKETCKLEPNDYPECDVEISVDDSKKVSTDLKNDDDEEPEMNRIVPAYIIRNNNVDYAIPHSSFHMLQLNLKANELMSGKTDEKDSIQQYICRNYKKIKMKSASDTQKDEQSANNRKPFKPYACDLCPKRFNRSSHLKRHIRTHFNDRPYVCDICQKSFNQSSNLKKHKVTHTTERPFVCELCQKSFKESSNLKKHMIIHTDVRPYTCEVCQKSFNRNFNLKSHMRTHTNERPYACHLCEKRFNERSTLTKHMRTHPKENPPNNEHFMSLPYSNVNPDIKVEVD